MKLTKKSTKTEVETTETVCEITQDEFEKICAKVAAKIVIDTIGDNADVEDFMVCISMTKLFAEFTSDVCVKLFNDTNENPDKKEEK